LTAGFKHIFGKIQTMHCVSSLTFYVQFLRDTRNGFI